MFAFFDARIALPESHEASITEVHINDPTMPHERTRAIVSLPKNGFYFIQNAVCDLWCLGWLVISDDVYNAVKNIISIANYRPGRTIVEDTCRDLCKHKRRTKTIVDGRLNDHSAVFFFSFKNLTARRSVGKPAELKLRFRARCGRREEEESRDYLH